MVIFFGRHIYLGLRLAYPLLWAQGFFFGGLVMSTLSERVVDALMWYDYDDDHGFRDEQDVVMSAWLTRSAVTIAAGLVGSGWADEELKRQMASSECCDLAESSVRSMIVDRLIANRALSIASHILSLHADDEDAVHHDWWSVPKREYDYYHAKFGDTTSRYRVDDLDIWEKLVPGDYSSVWVRVEAYPSERLCRMRDDGELEPVDRYGVRLEKAATGSE